jgi:hypothetical protein
VNTTSTTGSMVPDISGEFVSLTELVLRCADKVGLLPGEFMLISLIPFGAIKWPGRREAEAFLLLRGQPGAIHDFDEMPSDCAGVIVSRPGEIWCSIVACYPEGVVPTAPGGKA